MKKNDWKSLTTRGYFGERWKKALWVLSGAWLVIVFLGWAMIRL